jgi:ribosomal-protein-alanine N-acetyltransferase
MRIESRRVFLKPFEPKHLYDPAYYGWLSDVEVVRYIGREELLQSIKFEDIESYIKQLWDNEYCNFFAIHDLETNKFIGTAKLNFISAKGRKHGIADVGIMLGERAFWGHGLGSEVLQAISIFAFDNLHARKLTAGGYSENLAIVKAFLRIGYTIEGTLRQQLTVGGVYCDHILMGCFEPELVRTITFNSFGIFD